MFGSMVSDCIAPLHNRKNSENTREGEKHLTREPIMGTIKYDGPARKEIRGQVFLLGGVMSIFSSSQG